MRQAKRVLFVERKLRNEKLGIMYLAGSLAARGHSAELIRADREDLGERIRDYRPDFAAFSITTGEHVEALKLARQLKAQHALPTIFGGPHCTFFPEIGFEEGVDFVVQGQGERALVDIVEGRVPPGFHQAPMVPRLDDFPTPARDIFYRYPEFRENPMKNVITSRACPYKCSYCFNHSQMALTRLDGETKPWFNRRRVEHVVREIQDLRERYPVEKVLFIDDSFVQGRSWLESFAETHAREVRLPWLCSMRVNRLDERLAESLVASGLEMVNYALESADPEVQQRLLHRGHISNRDVIRAIRMFERWGVRARMQNMIGLPLSNPLEDALNTLRFNLRHRVTDSWCSIFQPYPRTALGQYCMDQGYIDADQLRHCSESFFDESRLNLPHKPELYALQKLWYFIVEGDLPLDLVQILIRGEFTPAIGAQLQELRFRCSRRKLYDLDDERPAASTIRQRREPTVAAGPQAPGAETNTAHLLRAALQGTSLPDPFVEVLCQVRFAEAQRNDLARYLKGERVYPEPIYTVDDETGELADPAVSIHRRGTTDPEAQDIRLMPEEHFMRDMVRARDELRARGSVCVTAAE